MSYNSKNVRTVVEIFYSTSIPNFLKVRAKYLVKVATIGEVISRKRPPILRELSFKFGH